MEVYQYMKSEYQKSGEVPTIDELTRKFVHVPWAKVQDAICEFNEWKEAVES